MSIFINPGSGPVAGATEDNARENMRQFVKDVAKHVGAQLEDVSFGLLDDQGDGRWRCDLRVRYGNDVDSHEVDMPGLPLRCVRSISALARTTTWDFPRLYIDGSSWVWPYAVSACEPYDEDDDA